MDQVQSELAAVASDCETLTLECGSIVLLDHGTLDRVISHWNRTGKHTSFRIGDRRWYRKVAGRFDYVVARWQQSYLYIHRAVTECPANKIVDHRNRNRLDNRSSNLRVCDIADNNHNIYVSRGKSPYKGVVTDTRCRRKPWFAQVRWFDGIKTHVWRFGGYASQEEAARQYDRMAKILYGEYALTNFPLKAASS